MKILLSILSAVLLYGCQPATSEPTTTDAITLADYHSPTDRDGKLAGGVRMIPITTPSGNFNVWTKRVGNNPKTKVLLLHGGPGVNHAYFECFDSYLPAEGHRIRSITTSWAPGSPTSRTTPACGRSIASWMK